MGQLAMTAPSQTIFTESAASQRDRARLARKAFPRKSLAEFVNVNRDPVEIIAKQNEGRIKSLIPLRHQRMAASAFTFYRGTAGLMAHDLAQQPQTGTQLVICGDAHISNFGLYASPERRLIFDLNDFDEAAPGPWEWDVRRMLTSIALAAREIGISEESVGSIVRQAAKSYRENLARLLELPALARNYYSVDDSYIAKVVRERGLKAVKKTTAKARKRDSDRAVARLMGPDSMGYIRFKDEPPILSHVHVDDEAAIASLFEQYRESTLPEIAFLLTRFTLTDIARRVVGVGSVGTRCFVLALTGPEGKPLILQPKQALRSVVTQYSNPNITTPPTLPEGMSEGERVITHQRILQSVSDPFLGHLQYGPHSFYVRQFRDYKGSFDTTEMDAAQLADYGTLCALLLARAHSQSPLAHWVSGYIGDTDTFDKAISDWAMAYADQAETDYGSFLKAIEEGRLDATSEEHGAEDAEELSKTGELASK